MRWEWKGMKGKKKSQLNFGAERKCNEESWPQHDIVPSSRPVYIPVLVTAVDQLLFDPIWCPVLNNNWTWWMMEWLTLRLESHSIVPLYELMTIEWFHSLNEPVALFAHAIRRELHSTEVHKYCNALWIFSLCFILYFRDFHAFTRRPINLVHVSGCSRPLSPMRPSLIFILFHIFYSQ